MEKKKSDKIPSLKSEHKEMLAKLSARPEFKALEQLCRIEEHNIVIQSFKINSSDVDLARKKAWMEGRIWELRKILRTFEESKKGKDDEE